jgi:hypothetical protein
VRVDRAAWDLLQEVTSSNGLDKDDLLARPVGRARRMLHDDMTVVVVFIKVSVRRRRRRRRGVFSMVTGSPG